MATTTGPSNPFLADSRYAIGHGRCDQQDNSDLAGPTEPTDELQYQWLGPAHFGSLISGPYPDGKRVIWSNGGQNIHKLDYETLNILASFDIVDELVSTDEMRAAVTGLDQLEGDEAMAHAMNLALSYMTGLEGVYALLDHDHTLFLGRSDHIIAYGDQDPTDRHCDIVEKARWNKPSEITGRFVGCNITFDGKLVISTDHGWIICLERDFSSYEAIQLPGGAEHAAAHCFTKEAEMGHTGYGWVRTSMCVGDDGGIYTSSVDTHHKVIWTGERLSLDPADGAWSAPYHNGTGNGSGTTPSLMGFGPDEDHFVVFGDGDEIVGITFMWRDEIPDDWTQLPGAPSRRVAGIGTANMDRPELTQVLTEQSITVSGYGAMTVNNEPASIPDSLPGGRGARLLAFYLGHKPEFTPYGLHKYEWDPVARRVEQAWVNNDVSSPNSVPFVSNAADLVYTCGVRGGQWSIEAVDWSTGEERFHVVLGGSQFNTLGAGVTLDDDGRLLFGTIFGKVRIS
ncbi:MAG: hypothetical protein IH940_08400 [Acidobacteria bacterium]|nr:hypothetical protein [Acidobacteriota bacterium]